MGISAEKIYASMSPYKRARMAWLLKKGPIPLWDWQLKVRPMIKPGLKADWERFSYLRGILQCQTQRMVIKKSAQSGVSDVFISMAAHNCAELSGNSLYILPKERTVNKFSKSRVNMAFEASPELRRLVAKSATKHKTSDTATLKRIGNGFLQLVGGKIAADGSADQLKTFDSTLNIYDEIDEMDVEAVMSMGKKRLGAAKGGGREAMGSTPTYEDFGVDALYSRSDQRVYMQRCPSCGKHDYLTRGHLIIDYDSLERPLMWHGKSEGRAYCACMKCGAEWNRLAKGEWVAQFPERSNTLAGFWFSKLIIPYVTLFDTSAEIVEEGDGLINELHKTSQRARQECLNQDFGETYTPSGTRITDEVLNKCRRDYDHCSPERGYRPARGEDVYMGIDVQGDSFPAVIRLAPDSSGNSRELWAGMLSTRQEIGRFIKRFKVIACVIDANPERREVRKLQEDFQKIVWLAFYPNMAQGTKKDVYYDFQQDPRVENVAKTGFAWYGHVNIDRTWSMDEMFAKFYSAAEGEGGFTLPQGAKSVPEYYKQMKSPQRVVKDTNGIQVARYIKRGSDDLAQANNYCMVAMSAPKMSSGWAISGG